MAGGEARIAVSFVLNHEEGGDVRTAWGRDFRIGLTIWSRRRGVGRATQCGIHLRVRLAVGFWEIMRIFQAAKVEAHFPRRHGTGAHAADRRGDGAERFEVACHGQRWMITSPLPEDEERAHMRRNIEVITRLIGRRPLGWYTGRPGPNTRRLVVEKRRLSV